MVGYSRSKQNRLKCAVFHMPAFSVVSTRLSRSMLTALTTTAPIGAIARVRSFLRWRRCASTPTTTSSTTISNGATMTTTRR